MFPEQCRIWFCWGSGSILTLRWVSISFCLTKSPQKPPSSLSRRLVRIWTWKNLISEGLPRFFTFAKILQTNPKMEILPGGVTSQQSEKKRRNRRNRRRWWNPHNYIIKLFIGCKKKFLFQFYCQSHVLLLFFYH